MTKRVIPLLILAVVLASAPAAMAQCLKCKVLNHTCPPVTSGGFDDCYWLGNDCIIGTYCGTFAAAPPLASEYQVASVERADDPQPNTNTNTNETRIASLESKPEPKSAPDAHR